MWAAGREAQEGPNHVCGIVGVFWELLGFPGSGILRVVMRFRNCLYSQDLEFLELWLFLELLGFPGSGIPGVVMVFFGMAWIPKRWNSWSCDVFWEWLGFPGSGNLGVVFFGNCLDFQE